MAKTTNKKDKIRVSFIGNNAESVTGSMTQIDFGDRKVLLECGLVQTNVVEKDYKTNFNNIQQVKAKEIDTVFLMHTHIDHIGMLPRLYKKGCEAKIIVPRNSTPFIRELLLDSAFIMSKEAEDLTYKYEKQAQKRGKIKDSKKKSFEHKTRRKLSKLPLTQEEVELQVSEKLSEFDESVETVTKKTKVVDPLYTKEDVLHMLDFVEEYDMEEKIVLDENLTFEFLPSHHIINGSQLLLYIKHNNHVKKILYTSDLGNLSMPILFNGKFTPCKQANLVIAETTYSGRDRAIGKNNLNKDLEKLRCVIEQTCIDNQEKLVIPSFALDRTQRLVKYIYDIVTSDDKFKDLKIYVDSPLANRISKIYLEVLDEEEKEMYRTVLEYPNLQFVDSSDESKVLTASTKPCIILSASGMGKGRVKNHIRSVIENPNAMICCCGYACENTLVYQIKNPKESKVMLDHKKHKHAAIEIDGKKFKNNCQVIELHSFSSHIQKQDMLRYYSDMDYEKIALVHGNFDDKSKFADELKEENIKKNKSGKVVIVNKTTTILL